MTQVPWPEGWLPITDATEQKALNEELVCEAPQGHLLYGQKPEVVARRVQRDDFLFQLQDGRIAQVHLTWRIEKDPFWPFTTIYASRDAWADSLNHGSDGCADDDD